MSEKFKKKSKVTTIFSHIRIRVSSKICPEICKEQNHENHGGEHKNADRDNVKFVLKRLN